MKLLIIEDEPDMRNALKKGFIKKGYLVDTAEDGEEGSYLALVNTYDVIVLDLNLPGKDGLEILQEIRDRSKTQRVIILSARSSVPDKSRQNAKRQRQAARPTRCGRCTSAPPARAQHRIAQCSAYACHA